MIVTTVYDPNDSEVRQAIEISAMLQLPYIKRDKSSLSSIMRRFDAEALVVAKESGPIVHTSSGDLFFHLGMAALRIKNMFDGKPDHMVTAMALVEGTTVLDCTLGMGTDAIVASMMTGEQGRVTGLEISPLVAFITGWGLARFNCEDPGIAAAMRRIKVINIGYRQYLHSLPDKSYDVVYFDPMFRKPVYSSSGIRPLRIFADTGGVDPADIAEAIRIARQRVVIKEKRGSPEFSRLGLSNLIGGKYSSVQYGVIELEGV